MPKARWGTLTQEDIDSAESSFKPYEGPVPPKGVYRFVLKWAEKTDAKESGNPMLRILLILDGSWKEDHKQYDGCPLFMNVVVIDTTAFQVRGFCDAIGVTSKEFMNNTVLDEDDRVVKIGKVRIKDEELLVKVNCKNETWEGEKRLKPNGVGWLPMDDADEDESDEEYDDDEAAF